MLLYLLFGVSVSITHCYYEYRRDYQRGEIRKQTRAPNPVDIQNHRQNDNESNLKHNCSQKRNQCGNQSVVQRREQRRTVNIETAHKENQSVYSETVNGYLRYML